VSQLLGQNTLTEVCVRAENGDGAALEIFRQLLDLVPEAGAVFGDLAQQAEKSLLDAAFSGEARKEATRRELKAMRQELEGPQPTPLERLLVARVVACWFQVQHADTTVARSMVRQVDPQTAEYYMKRQDRANKRFLAAAKTLAQVRKLLVPTVQINIAQRQVNVGSAALAKLPPDANILEGSED
jgi:hypothetical protein